MAEDKLNIYQRLAKVRKAVEVIQKNAKGYGYDYVTEDEILAMMTGTLDKYAVSLIPEIVPGTFKVEPYNYTKTKSDKNGNHWEEINNEIIVQSDMKFTWVNNDNPEDRVVVPWSMVGHQADGSQSFGTALTYAYRYFLLKYFGIATPKDDPDAWRSKQKEAEETESRTIAESIINEFDTMARMFCAEHPDKKDDLTKLVTKYVKSGNYKTIKNAALASKMMQEFRTTFMPEREE